VRWKAICEKKLRKNSNSERKLGKYIGQMRKPQLINVWIPFNLKRKEKKRKKLLLK
jgi:hypothetical protein